MYQIFFLFFRFDSTLGSHSIQVMSNVKYLEVTFL